MKNIVISFSLGLMVGASLLGSQLLGVDNESAQVPVDENDCNKGNLFSEESLLDLNENSNHAAIFNNLKPDLAKEHTDVQLKMAPNVNVSMGDADPILDQQFKSVLSYEELAVINSQIKKHKQFVTEGDGRPISQIYSEKFSEEEMDYGWALEQENTVYEIIDNVNLPSDMSAVAVECRQSLCKVEFQMSSMDDTEQQYALMLEALSQHSGAIVNNTTAVPDREKSTLDFYIYR